MANNVTTNRAATVITVKTPGPQGPKGDRGATGDAAPTGSLISTASISSNTITFTKGDATQFTLDITTVPTASYITASNIDGDVGFTPSLLTDIIARNITASANIWASGSGGVTGFIYSDAYFMSNDSGVQKQLLSRLNDILYVGDNSLDAVQFSGGIDKFWVQSDITSSGNISASGDLYTTQLYVNNEDAPAIKSTLPAFGFPGELNIGGWVTSQYNSVTPTHNTRLTGQNIDIIPSGGLQIYSHTGPDQALYINYDAGGTKYTKLWGSWEADDISLTSITASGGMILQNLPTSDPGVAGQLYTTSSDYFGGDASKKVLMIS